jgi:tol-pal system protein YbgF
MTTSRAVSASLLSFALLAPASVSAADKEHKVIMAEIRMLQEEQQQLRQTLAGLNEALKALNTRLDADANRAQKAFADQRLIIESLAETTRVLREKSDETNVRLSTMTQEVQSLRQTVAAMPAPSAVPAVPATGEPLPGDPAAPAAAPAAPPPAATANVSPTQMWDRVYAVYTAGQYDLAAEGFQSYIRSFPTSPQADDAQLYIGHSLYNAGKYADAAAALQQVITTYPQSDSVPAAYYKMGLAYESLKQFEPARRAFEAVIKSHPGTIEATMAKQSLVRVQDKKEE